MGREERRTTDNAADETLFKAEEEALARANATLKDPACKDSAVYKEFRDLLKAYRRTYKQLKRVIALSDKQQSRLNELNSALETRNDFIKEVFGRYTSDELVDSILQSPDGLNLGGEKRHITILMTDLRGFTSMSENLSPEEVVNIINNFLEAMTEIIIAHGGVILEFIGDAILAIFGAPVARSDHALRAVACAVEMQEKMNEVNLRNRAQGYPGVSMGVGINTGDVVVGNIGSTKRVKFGVTGRHVNLTARIESFTIGGQVLISQTTADECGDTLRIDSSMEITGKGLKAPLTVYEVGGVGGDYNLSVPLREDQKDEPCRLFFPMRLRVAVLSSKYIKTPPAEAELVRLGVSRADIHAPELELAALDNLKIELLDHHGNAMRGDIYAKVTGSGEGGLTEITFTAIPGEVGAVLQYAHSMCAAGCRGDGGGVTGEQKG
ncbi:MAG: adenylate/guanylate cyclase domain-containing protein [Pseudomonadota bacterium]